MRRIYEVFRKLHILDPSVEGSRYLALEYLKNAGLLDHIAQGGRTVLSEVRSEI